MNRYSKRFRSAVLLGALVLGGCGSGSDEGGAANKADWEEKHASAVTAVSQDIDRTNQALNVGERAVLLSECTQLSEDLADAKKAVPAPDPAVDGALRSAFDAADAAAKQCIEGARIAGEAHLVEEAQRKMKTAREKMDAAESALKAWQ
jgi:hypothetical protein